MDNTEHVVLAHAVVGDPTIQPVGAMLGLGAYIDAHLQRSAPPAALPLGEPVFAPQNMHCGRCGEWLGDGRTLMLDTKTGKSYCIGHEPSKEQAAPPAALEREDDR